jgi:predicted membrane-bound spermidine synthase
MNPPPFHQSIKIAMMLILFTSGFCSLVYQTVWIREFRLLFGGAAPAAAAVLAIVMGGLGLGGKLFGTWVEHVGRPCRFYARIEIGIAIAAALSPALLGIARSLYLPTGGAATLGLGTATIVQLLITALVLGLPCFLMGGSLPAAMKFLQTDEDPRRSTTALFYALNVAGAVAGTALGTFYLLPTYGNQSPLILSALINGLIALGDRIAYLALVLNENLRGFGFAPMVSGWILIMSLIAFLPSLSSGIQFPLLVSLLGSGNKDVGRQLGQAYLWNTAGAISGSLIGGFILMPVLGAIQCLVVMAIVVLAMSILSFTIDFTRNRHDASSGTRPLRLATLPHS